MPGRRSDPCIIEKRIEGVLCDLDGVITDTASIHAKAWKMMFDEFLAEYYQSQKSKVSFDIIDDYLSYIDGKPRLEGIRSYLDKLHVRLPAGTPEDRAGMHSIHGLGKRKNDLFNLLLRSESVKVYTGSVTQVRLWKQQGLKIAVVSSSRNCRSILARAGLEDLFGVTVDGIVAEHEKLAGKPAPDTFLYASKLLGVPPSSAIVVEDSIAGVLAGKNGKFGLVVGIAHNDNNKSLYDAGADIVLKDLLPMRIFDDRVVVTEAPGT